MNIFKTWFYNCKNENIESNLLIRCVKLGQQFAGKWNKVNIQFSL